MMTKLILLGAGKIGEAILNLLSNSGNYQVTVADCDKKRLDTIAQTGFPGVRCIVADLTDVDAVTKIIAGHTITLSACPYFLTPTLAQAAKNARSHYFDLTEDVKNTRIVKQLANNAETAFVPQCGLAPGFISIVAHDLAKQFDSVRDIHMRVGALPLYPNNSLKYNLTWSTDGLVNEYCNPCEAIVSGQLHETSPLEELENLSIDGIQYEAFNTSGGLGSLHESWLGKVNSLNYKTIRYPGHRNIMKLLTQELKLGQTERRIILKEMLESAIATTKQDVAVIFVSVCGYQDGRLEQKTYTKKIYHETVHGQLLSAIQLTTAASACAVVDMFIQEKLPQTGFVRQEQATLTDFLSNRFGQRF